LQNPKPDKNITGNIGLYYVAYKLSLLDWHVLTTSRNVKGPDLIIYDSDFCKSRTVQVKAFSEEDAIGLGRKPIIVADYIVVCNWLRDHNQTELFVLKKDEAQKILEDKVRNKKAPDRNGEYWIEIDEYQPFPDDELTKIGSGKHASSA
jgi:hypothetical protein